VGLKIFFIRRYGLVGIPWATILAYSLLSVVPFVLYVPQILKRMESRAAAFTNGNQN
jgi:hypothetical protein